MTHPVVKSKPSDRLNPKTVDIFNKPATSAFASAYHNGQLPCKLVHGSVKHKLHWNIPLSAVPFDPVLVILADGLRETLHPYTFVSRTGFCELLAVEDASEKISSVLPRLIHSLREALNSKDRACFEAALNALVCLSRVTGPTLLPHLKVLIGPIASSANRFKGLNMNITQSLQELEACCGNESTKLIKSKIPTFLSGLTH